MRRPGVRELPDASEVLASVQAAADAVPGLDASPDVARLESVADGLQSADTALRGVAGVTVLLADPALRPALRAALDVVDAVVARLEARLDAGDVTLDGGLEALNATLIRIKDASWSVRHDRIRTAEAVADLAGANPAPAALAGYLSVQQSLSALDRLEVRGRDSAGIQVLVTDHGLDLDAPAVAALLDGRIDDPLLTSGAVRTPSGALAFVYKAAAEIGELGDNTRALRDAVRADALLRMALDNDTARAQVLGHTRWASVGIISQPNAHPLDSTELGGSVGPYVTAVLNGDVDNFADLKSSEGLRIAAEITTDAKVIPTLVSRHLASGTNLADAFRSTVAALDGSVAIAASAASDPDRMCLALRGSGQALYVGMADDAFIAASEPYGVIEEATSYLRMDGETPADPDSPVASRGQIVVLDARMAGEVAGVERLSYDGTPLPVAEDDLVAPAITTRDIDRGDHPHFLLKEISEAPRSFRSTLRGKLLTGPDGRLDVRLAPTSFPDDVRDDLAAGRITRVLVVGQGTAAVAGQSLATVLADLVAHTPLRVESALATELSGFGLRHDMTDTLVVAISQSGTTTDTNRTVDLVRARGGRVIAIVNRRASDLTDKSDGVLYTSDGRDVEMSVASTKAFYAQVAAGFLLAVAVAEAVGVSIGDRPHQELLAALRDLPQAMAATLEARPAIARAAQAFAPSRRSWAMVGNGRNLIAARELRIKLSELCYKSIACDGTEDKKHIDLSSEPMILVCATGLTGSTADDVAKEVAIYRAHKAAPIVIAGEGESRYAAALDVISVPSVHPDLGFVLSAMAGHLFGYEAALAIDAQALPLREARAAIEELASTERDAEAVLSALRPRLAPLAARFFDGLRAGDYDGHLESSTAVRLSTTLRFALGSAPLDAYEVEVGKVGTPGVVVEDLTDALTRGIEELTRPIDAIKHQAKTVTVGISRSDESILDVALVRAVLDAGAGRDRLNYATLKSLADLDPAVAEVRGFTRYAIDGLDDEGAPATITVIDKGGIAVDIPSRTDRDPHLRGTKNQVALERRVFVNVGRSDARTTVLVPEVKGQQTTGITLLHVALTDHLPAGAARSVLQGYRGRYAALRDAVMETEPAFRDDLLAEVPVVELLTSPIQPLADRWRSDR
ncbi:SIS domain-containing protein [Actinomarinicola tropica]|uniref:SIS domain-containing protein n=1 Tax=Actinomarinicola tropica TaxID=2789776 RepID=UPI001E4763DD|nr:SIS domain-containing protein [Actinomarinicola tropica]